MKQPLAEIICFILIRTLIFREILTLKILQNRITTLNSAVLCCAAVLLRRQLIEGNTNINLTLEATDFSFRFIRIQFHLSTSVISDSDYYVAHSPNIRIRICALLVYANVIAFFRHMMQS